MSDILFWASLAITTIVLLSLIFNLTRMYLDAQRRNQKIAYQVETIRNNQALIARYKLEIRDDREQIAREHATLLEANKKYQVLEFETQLLSERNQQEQQLYQKAYTNNMRLSKMVSETKTSLEQLQVAASNNQQAFTLHVQNLAQKQSSMCAAIGKLERRIGRIRPWGQDSAVVAVSQEFPECSVQPSRANSAASPTPRTARQH
jgi:predicted  nucleic acid-binding Zn-ribbon protein